MLPLNTLRIELAYNIFILRKNILYVKTICTPHAMLNMNKQLKSTLKSTLKIFPNNEIYK